ncbi:hypothetical protein [Pseudoalteromonas piscicida]|uniref:hypothetical protein n=1 Tax=Pseudoalteromonas piscicida TaxID=43662 RepID=UPI0030A35BCC
MKVKHLYSLVSLLCIIGTTGCSSESTTSNVIKTEGIWADIRLTANGERSRVVTEFNLNSSTGANIILSDGDQVQATVGEEFKVLEMDKDFLDIDYQGYFSQTTQGTEFKLELIREKENQKLTASVFLPAAVTLYSPVLSSFRKDERIIVEWKPEINPDTSLILDFTSTCTTKSGGISTFSHQAELDDNSGQFTLLLGSVDGFNDEDLDKSKACSSYVTLSRMQEGTVDNRFKSGSKIYAIQQTKSEELKVTLN